MVRNAIARKGEQKYKPLLVFLSLIIMGIFFYFQIGFHFGMTVRDQNETAKSLGQNNYFETVEYSFLIWKPDEHRRNSTFPNLLRITDKKTGRYVEFDARTFGCKDDRTYLKKVSYKNGVLYTYQYKDWAPLCYGSFKRKFSPEFWIKFFPKEHR